jgi:hypothetical protein
MRPVLSVLLLLATQPVAASNDNHGLDDWTPIDALKWFKLNGFDQPQLKDLEEIGVEGPMVLELDDSQLLKLGVPAAEHKKYHAKSFADLKRIGETPKDVFEWRAANMRLCDMWIVPALFGADWGLIWARFYDVNNVIEKHNDEIDETSPLQFWLTWLIAPTYPFWKIANKMNSAHTFVDDVIQYSLAVVMVAEAIGLVALLKDPKGYILNRARLGSAKAGWALLNYYVLWWIIPNFLLTMWFYLNVYVLLPIGCLIAFGYAVAGTGLLVELLVVLGFVAAAGDRKRR